MNAEDQNVWPELPLDAWKDTYATLHMWTQVVGKIRMVLSPHLNHWWETALYVTPRGITTSSIPYGDRAFQITFDFISHKLVIETSEGKTGTITLEAKPVATFYNEVMSELRGLGIQARINTTPKEVPDPIPFEQDFQHHSYDAEYANRFWRILLQSDRLMKQFRSRFMGKCSPVHFFWGSFDLTVTRFSGRLAPPREADSITLEAYSHECSSCGFWPGSGNINGAAFFAYAAPEPPGYAGTRMATGSAFYNLPTKGFILMYDDVRAAKDPDALALDFFQSTYEAAANLGRWDRKALEMAPTRKATLVA